MSISFPQVGAEGIKPLIKEIPSWDSNGLIPPNISHGNLISWTNSSPYYVSLLTLAEHFSVSTHRIILFRKLIEFRKTLKDLKISNGFQWIDGSYVTNIMMIDNREPNDIDVINWTNFDFSQEQEKAIAKELEQKYRNSGIHPFIINIEKGNPRMLIELATYWYSMWGHTRGSEKHKGFFQIDLAEPEDETERFLDNIEVK